MARTWSWPRGRAADALVAGATAVFVVGATLWSVAADRGSLGALGWVLLLTSSGALYLRRRHPVAVVAATLTACALYYPLAGEGSPILVTFMVALFTLAEVGRPLVAAGFAGLALTLTVVGELASSKRHLDDISLFLLTGWLVACVAVGGVVRTRRAYLAEAERRAATEERLRIARELHDVLGHDISLINVQAGAALHRLGKERADGETVATLAAIRDSSRRALRELRGTLGVLRQVDEYAPLSPAGTRAEPIESAGPAEPPERTPASLAALPWLLDRFRSAGLAVRAAVSGPVRDVPPPVDLAAYRIVQEALTNVTRHAGASAVDVLVSYGDGEVAVRVDDDGRSSAGPPGSGILGMTERAAALGGSLEAGPRPDGGFRVLARLPT